MPRTLTTIGFDADDTLWQNEQFFKITQDYFADLLSEYAGPEDLLGRLLEAEKKNLRHYGYGIKGFTLSMIETALDVTGGRAPGHVIRAIMDAGRDMLDHPVELLPHAQAAVEAVAPDFRVALITKGDLLHQERKLAASGLGDLFDVVEIVSEKTADTYRRIFSELGDGPERAMMVGNSLRSDVTPALEAGGWGVFVPHDLTWDHEHAPTPDDAPRYRKIDDLGALPALVKGLG